MKKWLHYSAKTLKYCLFFTLFVLVLLVWLINTNIGNSLVFKTLHKIEPNLNITLTEGSLLYAPSFEQIRWQQDEMLVELNNVSYDFDWNCLLKEFCVNTLKVDSATINIPESEEAEVEEETDSDQPFVLTFPLPIHIKALDIKDTNVKVAGLEIDLKSLFLKFDGIDNDITVDTAIDGLTVTLPDAEEGSEVAATSNSSTKIPEELPAILTDGALPEVVLPFNLTAKSIKLSNFNLIQDEKALTTINQLETDFTYFGSAIDIQQFVLDVPEANVDLDGKIDLSKRYAMDLNANIEVKDVKQLTPASMLKGQKIQLSSKGDLGQLETNIELSNLINASLTNKVDLYSKNLPHKLNVSWQEFNWPLKGTPEITIKNGLVSSNGDLSNYQLLVKSDYALPDLPNGEIDLSGQGNLTSLDLKQLIVKTLEGDITLKGNLGWANNIKWLGDLSINGLNFQELSEEYPAELSGHIEQSVSIPLNDNNQPAWAFELPTIDLNGSFLTRPLSITGKVKGDEKNGLNIDNLNILNGQNTIKANGKVADKSDLILDLDIQDLSKIVVNSMGSIKGKVLVEGSLEKLEITSELNATELQYLNDKVESLNVNGKTILGDLPVATLNVAATNLRVSDQKIDDVTVVVAPKNISKSSVQHDIDLAVNSKMGSSELEVEFTQALKSWEAALNNGLIKVDDNILRLAEPFTVSMQGESVNLTEHCWLITNTTNAKNGDLCVKKLNASEQNGDIELSIDNFVLNALKPFFPPELSLEGALQADIDMQWKNANKPDINVIIDGKSIAMNILAEGAEQESIRYPVETLHVELKADQKRANFSLKAFSEGIIDADIDGYINPYQEQPSITSNVKLIIPEFANFSMLIPDVEQLSGNLQTDLSISGLIDKPVIDGQVLIADAYVRSPSSPVKISELNTHLDINKNKATIKGYFFTNKRERVKRERSILGRIVKLKNTAISTVNIAEHIANINEPPKSTAQENGRVDITGGLDWSDKFTADVNLKAEQMKIDDYTTMEIYLTPDIDILFNDVLSIVGTVEVDRGNITIKELAPGAVTVSNDIVVVDSEEITDTDNLPINIDLKVGLGEALRLKAIGLDTYVLGNLLVRQTPVKDLTVNGELSFSEGKYQALGQDLVLQNSRVIFQGEPGAPYLNIEAIRDTTSVEDNVTAGVRVTGTPDELKLVIFSDPSMSQQNALSYITTGQSIESSDGSNGQLASLLISLSAGQTDGMLNNIGDKLGIEDLSLDSSGQGDEQSVGLKGTIAPGVEVSYGVGVFDSFTIFAIRYELFKRFYVEASSGLYQAVDAYYEWDWD
ncbi:translocation/assembly module TamB domain-containing protein [Psychromonas aquatilis]|uniref:Translocation/assembly module TamB domain-containing protein n=1 Tax=Psychromonas aquatilis TaxID=2005072 RepID=A0ABU9GR78_9GAMM